MKTVLITGAGTGIGKATAEHFLKNDWQVIAVGRRAEPLENLATAAPKKVLPVTCDLSRIKDVEELAKKIQAQPPFYETLSVLVNNAGIYERKRFADSTDELWQRTFETNLMGSVRITRAFLKAIERNRGVIINVSSTLGLKPVAETSVYSALKAAMINWTQALALEIAPSGARANCVCPGIVDTPIHSFDKMDSSLRAQFEKMQPLGRVGRPEDIAHAIYSLSGPGSEWITGASLSVDGGIILAGS